MTPALALALLSRARTEAEEGKLIRSLKRWYFRLLPFPLSHPRLVVGTTIVLIAASGAILFFLQSSFLPEFHEGNLVMQMMAPPGTSLEESVRMGKRISQSLKRIPGVASVAQFAGRAELSEDTWGPEASEFHITLDPNLGEYAKLTEQLREQLIVIPGFSFNVLSYLTMVRTEIRRR